MMECPKVTRCNISHQDSLQLFHLLVRDLSGMIATHAVSCASHSLPVGCNETRPALPDSSSHVCAATIKHWTIWLFWLDPLSYAQRGLLVNEFRDPRWQVSVSSLLLLIHFHSVLHLPLSHCKCSPLHS